MDLAEQLVAVLTRVDAAGNDVYRPEEIRHALPYLVVALQLPLGELTPGLQDLVAETALRGGGADPVAGLVAFYEENPVDARLLDDVRRALTGSGEAGSDDALRRAAARLGQSDGALRPLDSGVRPAGTVPASLARLSTIKPKPK